MTDVLVVIDAKLAELSAAMVALEEIRAQVANNGTGPAARHPELVDRDPDEHEVMVPRSRGRGHGRKRESRRLGTREQAIVDTLGHNPDGLTIPELAAAMDSSDKYLYRALPRLLERGRVRTDTVPAGTELGDDRTPLGHEPKWYPVTP